MSEKIVLIDGHSIINRAFYGVPDLTNKDGLHTNGIFGFVNILFKILEEEKPDYLTVAFDVHHPTFRHEMFKEYKGTRKGMPQELHEQVPVLKELLTAMGIQVMELLLQTKHTQSQILGRYQCIMVKKGQLYTSASNIHDGSLALNNFAEFLALCRHGFIMQETLLGIAQDLHSDAGALLDLIVKLPVLRTANRLLGFLLGVLCAAILGWLFAEAAELVMSYLHTVNPDTFATDIIDHTLLVKYLCRTELLHP